MYNWNEECRDLSDTNLRRSGISSSYDEGLYLSKRRIWIEKMLEKWHLSLRPIVYNGLLETQKLIFCLRI